MTKRKIKINANELGDVDVSFISLVDRGANRIPFRVLKNEGNMNIQSHLDLASIFKKSEVKPSLVAIAVPLGEANLYTKSITEKGFTVHSVKSDEEQGVDLLFTQEQPDIQDIQVVKMNEDIAILVSNTKKAFSVYPETTDFSLNIQKAAFFPSASIATEVLMETMLNVMYSDDATDHVSKIETIVDDFKSYMVTLAKNIPSEVFKLETVVKTEEVVEEVTEEATQEEAVKAEETAPATEEDQKVEKSENSSTEVVDFKDVLTQMSDNFEAMFKSLNDSVDSKLKSVSEKVDELSQSSHEKEKEKDEQLATIAQKADQAIQAMNGTLVGDVSNHQEAEEAQVFKSTRVPGVEYA